MTDHDQVHALLTSYRESAYRKDVDGFMAMYSPDVRVFDLWGSWEIVGASRWREGVAGWFESLNDDRVVAEFDDIDVSVGADLATVTAMIQYSGESSKGQVERQMANRLTWILKRSNDGWLVVHEHTSAPVDMQSGKVILAR